MVSSLLFLSSIITIPRAVRLSPEILKQIMLLLHSIGHRLPSSSRIVPKLSPHPAEPPAAPKEQQLQWPPCWLLKNAISFPPQGLCTAVPSHLFYHRPLHDHLPHFIQCSTPKLPPQRAFLHHLFQNCTSTIPYSLTLLLLFLGFTTIWFCIIFHLLTYLSSICHHQDVKSGKVRTCLNLLLYPQCQEEHWAHRQSINIC